MMNNGTNYIRIVLSITLYPLREENDEETNHEHTIVNDNILHVCVTNQGRAILINR
jgi:hypothetical protein